LTFQEIGDIDHARKDYRTALRINPDHGLALNNLAVISSDSKEGDSTEYYLSKAIESSPDLPYPYAERGYYWIQQKRYSKAIDDYTRALEIIPRDHELWLNRGIARMKLDDFQNALNDLNKAIDLKPDYSLGFMNRGNVHVKMENFTGAIEDFTIALIFDKRYGLAYYNRALAYRAINEPKKACSDLLSAEKEGIKINPKLRQSVCKQP
jgi:tetratricopeptide (TPR) repeat protein